MHEEQRQALIQVVEDFRGSERHNLVEPQVVLDSQNQGCGVDPALADSDSDSDLTKSTLTPTPTSQNGLRLRIDSDSDSDLFIPENSYLARSVPEPVQSRELREKRKG